MGLRVLHWWRIGSSRNVRRQHFIMEAETRRRKLVAGQF
jgi:hypothetical protein